MHLPHLPTRTWIKRVISYTSVPSVWQPHSVWNSVCLLWPTWTQTMCGSNWDLNELAEKVNSGEKLLWPLLLGIKPKLQALVYDILPSTTAVFSYTLGPRKLSANEQFFVGAQTVVSLLQTTQIMSDACFITMLLMPAQIKPKSFESRQNSLFVPGADEPCVYVRAWALGCFHSHISTQTFWRALTTR